MAITAQYAAAPRVGSAVVSLGDSGRTSPVSFGNVFTAGASGSRIDQIDLQAIGSTIGSAIRLWLFDGAIYTLWRELPLLSSTVSSNGLSSNSYISSQLNSEILPLILPPGMSLRASVHDTQVVQNAQVNSLVAAGTLNGNIVLSSSIFTNQAASAAAVCANQSPTTATFMALTSAPYVAPNPSVVSISSGVNASAASFTIHGTDTNGVAISETIAGPNVSTVFSTRIYDTVSAIYVSGTPGAVTVGINSSVTLPITHSAITITSAANISGSNFTIRGVNRGGVTVTEVLAGPAAGLTVTSVNSYRSINLINASASSATTSIGTPAMLSGVNVIARGGDL